MSCFRGLCRDVEIQVSSIQPYHARLKLGVINNWIKSLFPAWVCPHSTDAFSKGWSGSLCCDFLLCFSVLPGCAKWQHDNLSPTHSPAPQSSAEKGIWGCLSSDGQKAAWAGSPRAAVCSYKIGGRLLWQMVWHLAAAFASAASGWEQKPLSVRWHPSYCLSRAEGYS